MSWVMISFYAVTVPEYNFKILFLCIIMFFFIKVFRR